MIALSARPDQSAAMAEIQGSLVVKGRALTTKSALICLL